MSYFAKPSFIPYDEWFDNDIKKTKNNFKNKNYIAHETIHEFFYKKSNHNIGGSENNVQLEIEKQTKLIFPITSSESFSKNSFTSPKEYKKSIKQLSKHKFKNGIYDNLFYLLSALGLLLLLGSTIFIFSQSSLNEKNIINEIFEKHKKF